MPGVAVPLKIFLAPIELAGVFIKPIALTMRIFANMAAGHITILSMVSIIFIFGNAGKSMGGSVVGMFTALPLALFSSVLEVLVAFLQPFIFAMLTSVFLGMALESGGHEVRTRGSAPLIFLYFLIIKHKQHVKSSFSTSGYIYTGIAAIGAGLAALGAGIGIGLNRSKATEAIARQPEATNDIRGAMILTAALSRGCCADHYHLLIPDEIR
jgi:F0F1-type ATP synthase membrane subunit c/vacuolar-type H+-ATPase subunit K